MYVDNVRKAIFALDNDEYEEYIRKLRSVLMKKYNKSVKPSELRKRVDEFVFGNNPHIDYFESYLLAFDELSLNGATNAFLNKDMKIPKTWRQLLLKVTEDRTLPANIFKHLDDEVILTEMKVLFFNSIKYCEHENKDRFFENLYILNSFFKIKSNGK